MPITSRRAPKRSKSTFRKISEWLHLWLGLFSGIVVFVVCFTAAIWVFRDEIAYFTMPFNRVELQNLPVDRPSIYTAIAQEYLDSNHTTEKLVVSAITYREPDESILIEYADSLKHIPHGNIHLNPYTKAFIHDEYFEHSNTLQFIYFIRAGHRFFWLPPNIGSPFVGINCLVFLVVLITGIIWWYPKKWNSSTRKKSFRIKWRAKWKRLNIDLHNVLGFYTLIFAFILTYTGVYYSFDWFKTSYHTLLGEAKTILTAEKPISAGSMASQIHAHPWDAVWEQVYLREGKSDGHIKIGYPRGNGALVYMLYNPIPGKYYGAYTRMFNATTLAENPQKIPFGREGNMEYDELSAGQKLIRLNFDLHLGTIGGLSTKILACIVSLVCASLPITGFIIWYNRKRKKKKILVYIDIR
ncbi:PepSY-associated TM helix domain-containing protein [Sphingobacterium oryzagri]|uniref:PepSY-associated TM helix domain-containing protein n=1 Tax=Sphingobacterium oryzagri TaxID=3025669 RepID=A0ABY7WC99_9SPHI|nr:PepSY-associated TM helix domain-containing protein [Sphingobacterium sp. KACC 22765]WDF67085.1 PepSY-associated TM helix domain-containing protein [Sphingobacterium sp. KACC 22765]